MEFSSIDLTLAVNYLPAVECIFKVLCLSCVLCLIHVHLGAFPALALMLNIDRALSNARIFDGNAVQYSVLLSWFINILRADASAPVLVWSVATILWMAFSFLLVVEPVQVQEFFVLYRHGARQNLRQNLRQIIPAVVNGFFVGFFVFLPFTPESYLFRVARTMAFAALCVGWVYVVTVWKPHHGHGSHALLARFSPVLYVHPILAGVYFVLCIGVMIYHYVGIHMVNSVPSSSPGSISSGSSNCSSMGPTTMGSAASSNTGSISSIMVTTSNMGSNVGSNTKPKGIAYLQDMEKNTTTLNTIDEDEDLEAMLRTAKQSQGF